ncbi:proton-coupled zinc antiporter SLC30A1-like [Mya arenaria]|uniref:proton-coupled zinc antiporter SLC30A1-like n=1 Tax=Mya arenaria TaxID=6604 RepID=UPI0022E76FCA|nr:proton-coupled zinc antiporter SLC30A1-like [Mya arenaria]XP_052799620.1 proton-coupled zinc antiporter SLC30A1-like [Mya arenaria]XP_052799621.1 proton-coupled zinc antiporter SLC30A1-like [Mya arenaria]XP_052799622.1 proton-coupled zinc antiporter SLC30A1-like [Mya arenaria]
MGKLGTKTCRLLTMLGLTASFFLVEIIVGYITNSIALVADSFHMLSDVVALIVGFASVRISKWRTKKNTFGWARAEVLGAMINSVFLIALCFSIMVEALKRLVEVEKVENPKLLLIVGAAGLGINLIGLLLFHNHGHSHGGGGHGHSHGGGKGEPKDGQKQHMVAMKESESLVEGHIANGATGNSSAESDSEADHDDIIMEFDSDRMSSSSQLNMRAVFLHVLGDALGSVIVIISALVIWFVEGDWVYYVDPGMSVVMVCIILSTAIPLLKEAGMILLQTVPTHIQITDIKEKIEQMDGVQAVHEFHVWQLTGNRVIASAHIRFHNLSEYMTIAVRIKTLFHNAGIHSTTIQPEFTETESFSSRDCVLACGPEKTCYTDTCCPEPKKDAASPNASKTTPQQTKTQTETV